MEIGSDSIRAAGGAEPGIHQSWHQIQQQSSCGVAHSGDIHYTCFFRAVRGGAVQLQTQDQGQQARDAELRERI